MAVNKLRADQFVLRRHGADDDVVPVAAGAFELGNAGEIDQIRRRGEPQLHHRDEAVPAGERAAIVAELGEQADRFLDGFRAMVVKRSRNHGHPPLAHAGRPRAVLRSNLTAL